MIETPRASEWIPHKRLTKLYFQLQTPVLAYMRGAIAWPLPEGKGVALIAGQLPDKTIVVWEAYPFDSVLPVFKEDEQTYQGLSDFLGKCWALYRCRSFFWANDPPDVARHYTRLVYASEVIQPPPEFMELSRFSEEAVDAMFEETALRQGVVFDKGNRAIQEGLVLKSDPKRARAYHALRTLLLGYARMPYRE